MGASIWGVQRPGQLPLIVGPVGATTVTIGATDTTCFTPASAIIAPFRGSWSYTVNVSGVVTEGAATGTTLVWKLKNAAGTTLDTYTTEPTYLVNTGILYVAFTLVSTASATLYWPSGDTPIITAVSATHNATLSAYARAVFQWNEVN